MGIQWNRKRIMHVLVIVIGGFALWFPPLAFVFVVLLLICGMLTGNF